MYLDADLTLKERALARTAPRDGTPVDYGRIVGHLCAVDGLA
jgi:hypothetical protein